jgi:hypothetical protein
MVSCRRIRPESPSTLHVAVIDDVERTSVFKAVLVSLLPKSPTSALFLNGEVAETDSKKNGMAPMWSYGRA